MSNVTKFLLLAFGLGITILLITYFKRVSDTGFDTGNRAIAILDKYNNALAESDITLYDGDNVDGSYVMNFIKEHLSGYDASETSPFYVFVDTAATDIMCINNANISSMQDFSHPMYVKPVAIFRCSIVRDENDVIIGVNFVQQ